MDSLEGAPTDILNSILNFCDIWTKWRLRCANRRWFKLIDINEYICYGTNESQFNDIVETLEKLKKPVSLKLCKNVFQELTKISNIITRVTNLTGLSIEAIWPKYPLEEWMKLTKLQNLKSIEINSYHPMPGQIMQHFPNLEIASFDILGDLGIEKLTKLGRLSLFSAERNIDAAPLTNALLHLNHLTYLEIVDYAAMFARGQLSMILSSLHGLKNLSLRLNNIGTEESVSLNELTALEDLSTEKFPFHSVNSTRLTSLFSSNFTLNFNELESSLVNLKKIFLESADQVSAQFLTALTALEKCGINIRNQDPAILSYLTSTKLQRLRLYDLLWEETGIDLSPIASMTSLKKLHLNVAPTKFPEFVLSMTNLTNLYIVDRSMEGIDLSKLTCLEKCYLAVSDGCKINVSNLPNLENLWCDGAKAEFIGIENLTQLTCLNWDRLSQDNSSDLPDVSFLRNLPNLIEFSLVITGPELEYLTNSTNLQKIYLRNVTEENIEQLSLFSNLKYIRAQSVAVKYQVRSNLVNSPMTRLTNLEYLSWGDNSGLHELQIHLPKLWQPSPPLHKQK